MHIKLLHKCYCNTDSANVFFKQDANKNLMSMTLLHAPDPARVPHTGEKETNYPKICLLVCHVVFPFVNFHNFITVKLLVVV